MTLCRGRVYRPPAMKTLISLAVVRRRLHRPPTRLRRPTRGRRTARYSSSKTSRPLVGDIERVGDAYRVRRLIGETTVPADRVLRLCATWTRRSGFVRGRANLADPDERLAPGRVVPPQRPA